MPCRTLSLLAVPALLLAGSCGEHAAGPRVQAHPAHLAGRYAARPEQFRDEVVAAMRYELTDVLGGDDRAAAAGLQRHLERSSAAWCQALANVLDLRANGQLAWRVKEPLAPDPTRGIRIVDLPPPSIDAVYEGTWRQVAPGEIEVEFATRNGRPLRWPSPGRCRVRSDGGLDISWSRDVEMSIEEAPLLRVPR